MFDEDYMKTFSFSKDFLKPMSFDSLESFNNMKNILKGFSYVLVDVRVNFKGTLVSASNELTIKQFEELLEAHTLPIALKRKSGVPFLVEQLTDMREGIIKYMEERNTRFSTQLAFWKFVLKEVQNKDWCITNYTAKDLHYIWIANVVTLLKLGMKEDSCLGFCLTAVSEIRAIKYRKKLEEKYLAQKLCAICDIKSNLKCSLCGLHFYCSKEHQKEHWKAGHKQTCQGRKK